MNPSLRTTHQSRGRGHCSNRVCALHPILPLSGHRSGIRFLGLIFGSWILAFVPCFTPLGQAQTVYSVNIVGFKMAVGTLLDDAVNPESGTAWYAAGPSGPKITIAAGNLA